VVYIVPGMPEQKTWWRNLRGGAPVELTLNGRAVVLKDGAEIPAIANALRLYLERFPAAARLHAVGVQADGAFDAADLRKPLSWCGSSWTGLDLSGIILRKGARLL